MEKILPLERLIEIDNYISNGVDAVMMGTYFGAKAQASVFEIEEIIETHEKIAVFALYNRDFKTSEHQQLAHEIKHLFEAGLDHFIFTDLDVLSFVEDLDLDLKVIYNFENNKVSQKMLDALLDHKIEEVWFASPRHLEGEINHIKKGMHFFGNRFKNTHTKEKDAPFYLSDPHGTHEYSDKIISHIKEYDKMKSKGITRLIFETFSSNVDDVLFVVRSLEYIEDFDEFETIVKTVVEKEMTDGEDNE